MPATVQAIRDTGIPPSNDLESALLMPLAVSPPSDPRGYTAIVSGARRRYGNALVELYDLDGDGTSNLANISTRGFVQTADNVMIGGVIVLGNGPADLVVRAIGPSSATKQCFARSNALHLRRERHVDVHER